MLFVFQLRFPRAMVKFHAQDPSRNTLCKDPDRTDCRQSSSSVHRIRSHKAVWFFFLFSHIFCKNHFLLLSLPLVNHSDTSFCHFPKACSSKRLPSLLLIHASGLMLSALWCFFSLKPLLNFPSSNSK